MAGRISKAAQRKRGPRNLPHLAGRLIGTPLLIDARKLDAIVPVFLREVEGAPRQEVSASDEREPGEMSIDTANGIAVIQVIGSLVRRPTFLDAWSGLTSYAEIGECLDCALADARVKGILLQIDSFGGEAGGCFELCDRIYAARSQKPIWAVADIDALSAGYAILSSASKCYVAGRGSVGSIGVVSVHVERSQLNEAMGITYTVFRAGDRKADFNPYEKLSAEAAAKQLASMERTRQTFAETIARNRASISVQAVLDTEGQWYDPEDGLSLGLIDGVSTYDEVFALLAASIATPAVAAPDDDTATPPAAEDETGETQIGGDDPPCDPEDDPECDPETNLPYTEGNRTMTTETGKPPAAAAGNRVPAAPASPAAPAPAAATAEVIALDGARPVAETRLLDIAQMCRLAGFPEKTADFQLSADSVDDVRTKLQTMRAEKDEGIGEISNHQPAKGGSFTFGAAPAEAVASWDTHLKRAQATNPKFAAPAFGANR